MPDPRTGSVRTRGVRQAKVKHLILSPQARTLPQKWISFGAAMYNSSQPKKRLFKHAPGRRNEAFGEWNNKFLRSCLEHAADASGTPLTNFNVLDIGAGIGNILLAAAQCNVQTATGIEIVQERFEYGKAMLEKAPSIIRRKINSVEGKRIKSCRNMHDPQKAYLCAEKLRNKMSKSDFEQLVLLCEALKRCQMRHEDAREILTHEREILSQAHVIFLNALNFDDDVVQDIVGLLFNTMRTEAFLFVSSSMHIATPERMDEVEIQFNAQSNVSWKKGHASTRLFTMVGHEGGQLAEIVQGTKL